MIDMEFTEDAKAAIEDFIQKVIGRTSLSGEDRTEVEKELRSGYYESAESKAKERGDTKVVLADVARTLTAEGTPDQIAACYMKSYAGHLRRAGILSRTAAYFIDALIIGAGIFLLGVSVILILLAIGVPSTTTSVGTSYHFDMQTGDSITGWMVAVIILVMMAFFVTAFGYIICYNILLEGYFGRTVGKYLLGLKVLKTDGTKIGYREAILRNIPKYVGNFIVIDALIMLIFFNSEKQRAFDKVADTIVVHTRS
jgi:uncharacterized RDD family membrane protein YckC